MNTVRICLTLGLAVVLAAMTVFAQQSKTIKDQAEYNAYMTAFSTQDPAAKAAAMEAFVAQYPNSVVKIDGLEQAMAAYQRSGNQAKVEDTANRILHLDPNNIRALAIVVFIKRIQATQQGNVQLAADAASQAQRGLAVLPGWTKPEGINDADFQKLRNQMSAIFNGAAGFSALQAKSYAAARDFYVKSLQADPTSMTDTYQLAIALLESNPIDVTGFWYAAKAINLAASQNNGAAERGINQYAKAKYQRYHGNADGWEQFVQSVANQTFPPAAAGLEKIITKAPTLQEIACKAMQENDPAELSFSDWEFVLQFRDAAPCNKEAAAKVWAAIQAKEKNGEAKLKIPVKVIASTADSLDVAITDENQQANKPDLHVILEKPVAKPPAPGSMTDVIGVITNYTPDPFVFTMKKGELPMPRPPGP
jgi:hypothetical protein